MTDLRDRLKELDELPAPDLWHEVEARAHTPQPREVSSLAVVLIAAMLLLALAVAGAALVGSGLVKLPVTIEASAAPSTSPDESAVAVWRVTGHMDAAHEAHSATLLPDGRVLVAGGPSGELYDPDSESWIATTSAVDDRYGHSATLLPDGSVLVAGGQNPSDGVMASAELYSAGRVWTATGDMAERRTEHTATLLLDGRVLVAGGFQDPEAGIVMAAAEVYDPRTGTWTEAGSMNVARSNHTATLLADGTVLVTGGAGNASAELYDPVRDAWTPTRSMLAIRSDHTATLLPDGTVLVAGGSGSPGRAPAPVAEYPAELYDPVLGTWTATSGMIWPRGSHTATLLPDGRVLVLGGVGSGSILAEAELYEPATGTWTGTFGMIEARSSHTATLLREGAVLVTGGYAGGGVTLNSAELYDPRGGS